MGQSVFMIEVSKEDQGGTPLPTTSLQTKSESVIVGYTFKECCVTASPCRERRAKMAKNNKADMSCARVKSTPLPM